MSEASFKGRKRSDVSVSRSVNVSRRTSQTNFSHIYVRSLEESTPVSIALARDEAERRERTRVLPFVNAGRKSSMFGTAGTIWIKSRLSNASSIDTFDSVDYGDHSNVSIPSSPVDWIQSPASQYRGGLPRRRSLSQPPPIGSPGKAWGRFDTVAEILQRPQVS